MLQLSHISIHVIIVFLSNFPIIFFFPFTHFLKKIFTLAPTPSPTFSSPHYPLPSTLISFFISPLPFTLPFHLPTTFYLNITLRLSLHLPFFCHFLFTTSYYKFIIISSILYIFFPHKKGFLSLSLSLSLNLWWIFLFYFIFLSTILYVLFPHKKKKALSLSLSLSQFCGGFFFSFILALG